MHHHHNYVHKFYRDPNQHLAHEEDRTTISGVDQSEKAARV